MLGLAILIISIGAIAFCCVSAYIRDVIGEFYGKGWSSFKL